MSKRVTLEGISEHFTGKQIESIVRAAAEAVHGYRDGLSDTQVDLAGQAYELLMAEIEAGTPEPHLDAAGEDRSSFYRTVFADHATRHGIQNTWTAFYREFMAGGLSMSREELFGFLATFMTGKPAYDEVGAARAPWDLEPIPAAELVDGDLFSPDGGITWHLAGFVFPDTVSVYADERRGDDAVFTRIPVAVGDGQMCLVARPATPEHQSDDAELE